MADLALVRELSVASGHLAVIAIGKPDMSVHASLVSAGVMDDPLTGEPSIGIVVGGSTRKLRLLRASGRATAVFVHGFSWVSVEGPIRLEGPDDLRPGGSGDEIPALIRDVFGAAGGTHDDWDEFDRVMATERRCAVFLHARTITSNG